MELISCTYYGIFMPCITVFKLPFITYVFYFKKYNLINYCCFYALVLLSLPTLWTTKTLDMTFVKGKWLSPFWETKCFIKNVIHNKIYLTRIGPVMKVYYLWNPLSSTSCCFLLCLQLVLSFFNDSAPCFWFCIFLYPVIITCQFLQLSPKAGHGHSMSAFPHSNAWTSVSSG